MQQRHIDRKRDSEQNIRHHKCSMIAQLFHNKSARQIARQNSTNFYIMVVERSFESFESLENLESLGNLGNLGNLESLGNLGNLGNLGANCVTAKNPKAPTILTIPSTKSQLTTATPIYLLNRESTNHCNTHSSPQPRVDRPPQSRGDRSGAVAIKDCWV